MNNEQVVYINKDDGLVCAKCFNPLYTHPAKTLTDEEIKAVYGEYFDVENCDWLHLQCIQAILRKAQEK
jgi:Zn-finger protein